MQPDLIRFAYKLTMDKDEAMDLLQETFLKALDNVDKFTPETNLKGWLYTIMRNLFTNNYRKVTRDQTFVDQTENLYHLSHSQASGFDSTESAYDLKEVRKIVNALPPEYKIPFSMYVAGFKYRETAEHFNLPLGTVKSRIFFTRQKLQIQLKDFR
ncbi:MAG: RNA polymerase sigma factor [Bacteroides sp.]|nr:RNA polymerase sigma factor [Bacteroides sp.]